MKNLETFINAINIITNIYYYIFSVSPELFFLFGCAIYTIFSFYYNKNEYWVLLIYLICEFVYLNLFSEFTELGEFIFIKTWYDYTAVLVLIGFYFVSYVLIKTYDFEFRLMLLILMLFIFVFVSLKNLLFFYLLLEAISFSIYLMLIYYNITIAKIEASMKYFVVTILSSLMLLFCFLSIYNIGTSLNFSSVSILEGNWLS
jgi:NADH:ubiquinone oxidoreductase subunit 2 (subunit N)